jgi:hypothetical protein
MQTKILRVDDVQDAINEHGADVFADSIIQDATGDYFYVDCAIDDNESARPGFNHICKRMLDTDGTMVECHVYHKVFELPLSLAYFIIDALKLKAQAYSIGSTSYGGDHGGKVSIVKKSKGVYKNVTDSIKYIQIEDL